VKVLASTVETFIASENVAVMAAFTATPDAALVGTVEVTVGGVTSGGNGALLLPLLPPPHPTSTDNKTANTLSLSDMAPPLIVFHDRT
jgi:hypothetical protein